MPRRSSDQFGSPNLDDGTAKLDRVVDIAAKAGAQALRNVKEQYPRAVGSRKMNPEHEIAEYEAMKDYPDLLADLAAQNDWSLESFADYFERVKRKK